MEVGMRRLFLTTVSVVALGLGGAGMAWAAGNMNSNAGTSAGSNMPAATGTAQPGSNTGGNANYSGMSSTGAAQSGYNTGMGANQGMSSMAGTPNWGTGGHMSRRNEIMAIQQKLQADNLYNGKIDGRMGPETRQALRSYQQQNGLRATARVDRQTLNSILGTGSMGQGSSMPPSQPTARQPNAAK
jgi:peptidoglycan hydrolase-like protein with peptidoglycan-binding domain